MTEPTIVVFLGLASAATDIAIAMVFVALWRSDRQSHPLFFGLSFASVAVTLCLAAAGRWSGQSALTAPLAELFYVISVALQASGCLALTKRAPAPGRLLGLALGVFVLAEFGARFGLPGVVYIPTLSGAVYAWLAGLLITRRKQHAELVLLGVLFACRAALNLAWTPFYLADLQAILVQIDHVLMVTMALVLIVSDLTAARRKAEAASSVLSRQAEALQALNAQLAEERSEAMAANRAKSQFLANMSHELRTPLNAVIGFADLLANNVGGKAATSSAEYGTLIRSAGQHLLGIINDVLDMSRIESGKVTLTPRPLNLRTVLDAVMSLIIHHARTRRIGFSAQIDDATVALEGDEQLIKQVLTNLLSNAFKYTEPGGAVRLEAVETGDERIRITITDTGLGIAEKDLPQIFEPFVFSGSALTRRRGGIGLGLSITKRLVELHQGSIEIASIVGKGTTVTVVLPKRQQGKPTEGRPAARVAR